MTDTATRMQSLYAQYGELPGISIELHKDLIAIAIENSVACARLFLQGAQLSDYSLNKQPATLWLSPLCDYKKGQPLRGGVPICWPWFGDLDRNPAVIQAQLSHDSPPAHGFARNRDWQLVDIQIPNPEQTRLLLSLDINAGEESLWPYACQLQLQVDIGKELDIQLTTTNRDQHPFYFSTALHCYFNVSAIDNVQIEGLEGKPYIDALDDWQQHQQQGPLMIAQEVDRIYQQLDQPVRLCDSGWRRNTEVSSRGCHSAVLWNPWQDKARRLSCFEDTAYQQMLCIETTNAQENCVELQPGQSHQLATRICPQ